MNRRLVSRDRPTCGVLGVLAVFFCVSVSNAQDLTSLDDLKDTLQEIQKRSFATSGRNEVDGRRSLESEDRGFRSFESESGTQRSGVRGGQSSMLDRFGSSNSSDRGSYKSMRSENWKTEPGMPMGRGALSERIGGRMERGADSEYSDQLDDIRHRLQLIRKLRNEAEKKNAPAQNPFPKSDLGSDSITKTELQKLGSDSEYPIGSSREDVDSPVLTAIESNLSGENQADEVVADSPEQQADAILTAPVDELQLAQSLYQTKNYNAALNALNKIDRSEMSDEDYIWLDLLAALCRRRMGNESDSELLLRELSNLKSSDLSVVVARNWLKQSEICSNTRTSFEELSQSVDLLMERLKSNEQK